MQYKETTVYDLSEIYWNIFSYLAKNGRMSTKEAAGFIIDIIIQILQYKETTAYDLSEIYWSIFSYLAKNGRISTKKAAGFIINIISFLSGTFLRNFHDSLTPLYHFHPLQRNLNISRAITAESSPLHIASSQTRSWNIWFPTASR